MSQAGLGFYPVADRPSESWLTPPYIIEALGPFDLDPCAAIGQPWATAAAMYTKADDGLSRDWGGGRVWLNPPYGAAAPVWLERLARHGRGTALIFARTDTAWFHRQVWGHAGALLFLRGRVRFARPDGRPARSPIAPSVLVAYGRDDVARLAQASRGAIAGTYVSRTCGRLA